MEKKDGGHRSANLQQFTVNHKAEHIAVSWQNITQAQHAKQQWQRKYDNSLENNAIDSMDIVIP